MWPLAPRESPEQAGQRSCTVLIESNELLLLTSRTWSLQFHCPVGSAFGFGFVAMVVPYVNVLLQEPVTADVLTNTLPVLGSGLLPSGKGQPFLKSNVAWYAFKSPKLADIPVPLTVV